MWTPTTRRQHSREGLRYETDLTDAEWGVIEPLLPARPRRGRPPKWTMREVLDAIFNVLRGGIAWNLLPNDLPPKSTVFDWFCAFRDHCVFEKLNFAPSLWTASASGARRRRRPRSSTVRASKPPRAAARAAMMPARRSRGANAMRWSTDGRALLIEPHRADIQDRDAAGPVLEASRGLYPFIERLFADSAYAGESVAEATRIDVEIADQVGFVVLPRCWVAERFFAWINRNRRLAKDVEATIDSARAFLYAAAIMLLVRRIARAS
jgi:transposase